LVKRGYPVSRAVAAIRRSSLAINLSQRLNALEKEVTDEVEAAAARALSGEEYR
jgi:hypothetical protein